MYLLESTNTLRFQDQRVACKHMTSAEAVSPGSRIGDATGIEAEELVVLLAFSHSLEPTAKSLNEGDTRATWPSGVENDCPAEGRVI